MPTFSKIKLSGSTDGKGILVTATSIGSGTTIHTAQSTTTAGLGDNITLYASNPNSTAYVLTLGWGGTTSPDDLIVQTIPGNSGLVLVVADGFLWNALVVKASADTGSKITIFGYVNKIS